MNNRIEPPKFRVDGITGEICFDPEDFSRWLDELRLKLDEIQETVFQIIEVPDDAH